MNWMYRLTFVVILLGSGIGCTTGPHSAAGFRLPQGDAGRGRTAFLALECHRCHVVTGVSIARTQPEPPAPIVLGGPTTRTITDGYLVTSILYPQHVMAPGAQERIASGSIPPMPDYTERVTGRDLADLTAFLHEQYQQMAQIPNVAYY